MITDKLVEYITTQTNLHFKQNNSGKIFKPTSRVMRHLINSNGELCNSIDIRLYIASLLYRGTIHKYIAFMCYTQETIWDSWIQKEFNTKWVGINRKVCAFCSPQNLNLFILISSNAGSHCSLLTWSFCWWSIALLEGST